MYSFRQRKPRHCKCVSLPRRADARRSCLPCRWSPKDVRFSPHGDCSPYHGGLTPAALVNQRSCIPQVAVSPANLRTAEPPRAGGVSPPWRLETRMQRQSVHTPSAVSRRIAVVYADAILSTHGGLTPAALRKRAFVHRECRYFSVDRCRAP
jgi:hypothetical protein